MAERKPSSARIDSSGQVTQLDGKATPDEVVTEEDAKDAGKVARLLFRILRDLAELRRRWWPRKIDFEDVTLGVGGALVTLQHDFNGKVRWWVVDFQISGASGAPILQRWTGTDTRRLVLWSDKEGVATIRVEESG